MRKIDSTKPNVLVFGKPCIYKDAFGNNIDCTLIKNQDCLIRKLCELRRMEGYEEIVITFGYNYASVVETIVGRLGDQLKFIEYTIEKVATINKKTNKPMIVDACIIKFPPYLEF